MKTAIVPAQITTVEDKVTGSLSLSQLLLLAMPVFGSAALYILLPPVFSTSLLKIVLMTVLAVGCGLLAIRIKGQILLVWAMILLRYNRRPRYHIFNKNDSYLRPVPTLPKPKPATQATPVKQKKAPTKLQADIADVVKLEQLMAHPAANLHFVTDRKGGLSVRITEVK